jgi:myo-inositol 2-dehydrogenase / D-chiro-inositol 1-dehydrogenase
MLNIGIVGTGVMGAGHARFIMNEVPGARVVALFDIDEAKMSSLPSDRKKSFPWQ